MAQIRIGVQARNGASVAASLKDLEASRLIKWIEINGLRLDGTTLTSVDGHWNADSFHTTSVEFIGLPEFVYLGKDDQPLE